GGNANAAYNQDFVELFNRSTSPVAITGWTIQYASATGVFGTSNNTYTFPAITIPAGGYYLVGIAAAGSTGSPVATDQNATNFIGGLATAAGKVALATNAAAVTYTAPNTFSANVVDIVGYGSTANAYEGTAPANAPTSTAAIARASSGCTDTNDNRADFALATAGPHNAATAINQCSNPILVANPAALSFSATTGQVANVATYVVAGSNLAANAPVSVSSNNAAVLVSATGTEGSFASTASVTTATDGKLSQTIFVQFTAPATVGTTTAAISNSDGTRTASVAVIGSSIMAYIWNATGSTMSSYSTASNWTPARSTQLSTDVLIFDGAATPTPNVLLDYTTPQATQPTQTIGQLRFINNVAATLNTSDVRSLTLDGNLPGDDLVIGTGSTVTVATTAAVTTTAALTISLSSTETAAVGGTLIFTGYAGTPSTPSTNGRHTLQAPNNTTTGAIQFLAGSRFQATDTYVTASPFGTATANASSVVFRNGARFEQAGGATPFGNSTNPVTIFEPSSYFLYTGSSPALAGRTYGTLELNGTGTLTGGDPLTIQGDFIVSNGTMNINLTGSVLIQGNILVSNAARLTFTPASTSTVQLNGSTAQAINSTSTRAAPISFGANTILQINNAAGVTLGLPLAPAGKLQLTNGLLTTTTANILTLAADALDGSNTSFVNGPVLRPISAAGNYTFPIGKGASYRPLTLNVSTQSGTTYYRAEQVEGDPGQNMGASGLTRVSVFRSFTITPFASVTDAIAGTVTQPSSFAGTATLSFDGSDGVTNPAATTFVVGKRANSSQPWTNAGRSDNTLNTLTSGVFTTFSDFVLASTNPAPDPNPLPVTLTSFGAARQASGAVQVRWATASEQRSAYFEVQRSLDGQAFMSVERVAAQGTTTQAHTYASLDQMAPAGQLYYRLRQADTDGTSTFSPVVALAAATTTAATALPSLYPNPAHDYLVVSFAAGEKVQVLDLTGRSLQTTSLSASGQLSIAALPAGSYLLRVFTSSQPYTLRFTKE
ncbi:MAG: T9SS type A sorting domain-containing protein, partial [Hymenobacter sp.]